MRLFIWRTIPRITTVNTYILENPQMIDSLHAVDKRFSIREVSIADENELIEAHRLKGFNAYKRTVPPRLESPHWTGLAAFDTTNGRIAYLAWVITHSIPYFVEFGITLKDGQYLLKDGYCVPEYRHQGLHTRMEQERINYCVKKGASHLFIQINDSNTKGISSVFGNGYKLFKQSQIIQWSAFNVYRELHSFLRRPFVKIVK